MRSKIFTASAALAFVLAPQALLADIKGWVKIGATDKALGVYVDTSRIEKDGSTVKYWTKTVMRQDDPNKWNQYEVYYEGDCEKHRSKILKFSIIFVDGHVENVEGSDKWEDAKPKTVRGDNLTFACEA